MSPEPNHAEDPSREEVRAAYRRLGKIFIWSGWAVAFISLWLGRILINGLHSRIVELEKQNKELKQQIPPQNPR